MPAGIYAGNDRLPDDFIGDESDSRKPVSYTHLVTAGMHNALGPFMLQSFADRGYERLAAPGQLPSNVAQGAAAPVSYTHLDVYKRQD